MLFSWPRAILHIDGDSFFASCIQSVYPHLRGKPVVTGQERGVVTAVSAEAKTLGIRRQMTTAEVKRNFPQCVVVSSNYEMYGLISHKIATMVRGWTPLVEQYSIDEWFADITGFRRVYHCSYPEIAARIKKELEQAVNISISVGLSVNKSLAKLASNHQKPNGLTSIPASQIHSFLQETPIENVWGIGPNTASLLQKYQIKTTDDFAIKEEAFVKKVLSKPGWKIWQELQGRYVFIIDPKAKDTYQSISKIRTFFPTSQKAFLWGQMVQNLEKVCEKARRYGLSSRKISIYLKGQDFRMYGVEVRLNRPTNYPLEATVSIKEEFDKLIVPKKLYRATYVVIHDLQSEEQKQRSLFDDEVKTERIKKVFKTIDTLSKKYGQDTVRIGSTIVLPKENSHKRLLFSPLVTKI